MDTEKPKRRWFQFSLRTLLIFMALCMIPLSWLALKLRQAERQQAAVAALEELQCEVFYDYDDPGPWPGVNPRLQPKGPMWLRSILGNDFFDSAVTVILDSEATEAAIPHLKSMPNLRTIHIRYAYPSCITNGLSEEESTDMEKANRSVERLQRELRQTRVKVDFTGPIPVVG